MSDPTTRLPDLYQLLAIKALESDLNRIRAAMDRLLEADSDRNRKIAALAQKYLLDSQRKSAYDSQWKRLFGAPKTDVSYDYTHLNALLPSGDPLASFDLAAHLGSSVFHPPNANSNATTLPPAGHRSPAGNASKRLRNRKQQSILMGATLLTAGVGGLLLLGIFLSNRPSPKQNQELARIDGSKEAGTISKPSGPPKPDSGDNQLINKGNPRPSGLPQPGQSPVVPEIEAPPLEASAPMDMPMPNFDTSPSLPSTPTPTTPTPTTPPATTPPAATPPAATPPATLPNVSPDAKLSAAEKQAWQIGMTQAKQWIGQHKFDEAEKRLGELRAAAKTPLQLEQVERLMQVRSFVKDIRKEISDAISELQAAENFKIGTSTIASFVEGDSSKIIVKVSGERREYSLEEMPVPMGLALVDRKLDPQHATSLARKGAYIIVHPKNSTTLARGKQMLLDAAAEGAITMELAKFHEDDYSLAEKPQ